MKFFKCSVYVLFILSIANLAFSAYAYRDLRHLGRNMVLFLL